MTSIFLYEHITSGGLRGETESALDSLKHEGQAMLLAIADDFSKIKDVELLLLRDPRLPRFDFANCNCTEVDSGLANVEFDHFVERADWTFLIAPEIYGALLVLGDRVKSLGGTLLSPGPDFLLPTTVKFMTHVCLCNQGIPRPKTTLVRIEKDEEGCFTFDKVKYPAILKPFDGAGSIGIQNLNSPNDAELEVGKSYILEEFCPGQPASASFLCGPNQILPLPPFYQLLDAQFQYLGGKRIMDPLLANRASRLGERAIRAIGSTSGYVGVDLVLGEDPHGREDYIIEINARLTTSYLGIRQLTKQNLAKCMLDLATGKEVVATFGDQPLEFSIAKSF